MSGTSRSRRSRQSLIAVADRLEPRRLLAGLPNGDFEAGTLAGWTVVSGNAFGPDSVTDIDVAQFGAGNGQAFGQQGDFHLWGFKPNLDTAVGVLRFYRPDRAVTAFGVQAKDDCLLNNSARQSEMELLMDFRH